MNASQSKKHVESIISEYQKKKITIDQARAELVEHYLKLIPHFREEISNILTKSLAKTDIERAEELADLKIFESMIFEG
ncbi:hypothetical protein ACFX4I_25380 [Peribacillus sp. YIM B13472]|uniref:hypothetical protein n=1 Tax=Peribacillus sp. YIM B13472 TaxID=3366297 RepID=UPI00366C3741